MPVKHRYWDGRMKGLSSRNTAFRKVLVKEISVLYYTGYMKSLRLVHHPHYTSLEPSGFWSLKMILILHYLGIV